MIKDFITTGVIIFVATSRRDHAGKSIIIRGIIYMNIIKMVKMDYILTDLKMTVGNGVSNLREVL